MKKTVKIISITILVAIVILLINICMSMFTLTTWPLTKEEIINKVQQNTALLNEVPNEIKEIEKKSFYIETVKKMEIDNISIEKVPVYNIVVCGLINKENNNDNFIPDNKNIYKIIISKVLYKVFKIDDSIYAIERYYFETGRTYIMFDCGYRLSQGYFGFYYTEDNKPIGWKGQDVSFNQYKDRWIWKDPEDSERIYFTERIVDNWFYYEMRE